MFTDPLELNNEKLGALALERIELGRQRAALEQQRLALEQQRLEFNQKHILLTERGGDALRERERMLRERRADGALSDADRIDMHAAMLYVDCGIYAWAPLAAANSD